ncbi:protein kinase [candidate division CSSED10-310 bacterium]|uniref:Protein kinase n=1 Tax=candidate division CSSED10-310 bacterium TaxID=2855610 RepID=A0ABV6YS29_UNCC1
MNKVYVIDSDENAAKYTDLITQKGFLLFRIDDEQQAVTEIELEKPNIVILNIDVFDDEQLNLLSSISTICQKFEGSIIILTAHSQSERTKKALEKGAQDYLEFPPQEELFLDLIAKFVKRDKLSIDSIFTDASNYQSIEDFVKELLPVLSKMIQVEKIALILIDEAGRSMVPVGAHNISPLIIKRSKFLAKNSLVKTIKKFSKPIRTNKLFSDLRFMDISFEEKEKLLQMETDVLIPLHFMEEFRGIFTFGKKKDNTILPMKDLNELTKISYRICSFIFEIKDNLGASEKEIDVAEEMAVSSMSTVRDDDFPEPTLTKPPPVDAPPSFSIELQREETFADRFIIEECLGKGSLGVVYRALDTQLDDTVVLKIIYPRVSNNEKEIDSLKNKLSLSRKVNQKNIAPHFDFKEYGDFRYITMENVKGQSLKQLLATERQISIRRGITIVIQICDALTAIHEAGMYHGILKPTNIVIDDNDNVKVLDLGMRRPFDIEDYLNEEKIHETVEFISPEQASGAKIDHRADIYSLGIIMYNMFTGAVPFRSDTPISTVFMHVETPPISPQKFNTYLPYTIEKVILRCLEKPPSQRFQSVKEITDSLAQLDAEKSEGVFDDQFVASRQTDQVEVFLEQGKTYFEEGRFLDCIVEMKKVLSITPQHIKATEMIETASRKLEIDPSGAISPHILELTVAETIEKAKQQLQTGSAEQCVETIRSALKKEPENKLALELLATAQRKQLEDEVKKRKEDEKLRQKEIKRLYKEGKKLFKTGDYNGCIQNMEAILALDRTYSAAQKFIQKAQNKM